MTQVTLIASPVQIALVTDASMYTAVRDNALEEVLTMAEHVTKEQVIDWYRPYGQTDEPIPFETLVYDLRGMKAADVAPVRHGRWIVRNKGLNNWVDCSECGTVGSPHWKRCPVCEAKMDLEARS